MTEQTKQQLSEIAKRIAYQDAAVGQPPHEETRLSLLALAEALGIETPITTVRDAIKEGMEAGQARWKAAHPQATDLAPPIRVLVSERLEYLKAQQEGRIIPLPLPWNMLAETLGGGLHPGVHFLVGPTGTMKTQLALQISIQAAQQGHAAYFLGFELGPEQVDRILILASNAKLYWSDIGRNTPETRTAIKSGAAVLEDLPFRLDIGHPYSWSWDRFAPLADQWEPVIKRHTSPPLLVVDYLQLIASPEERQRDDVRTRIQAASYELRRLARDRGMVVLVLSSTGRQNYRPENGKPLWQQPPEALVGTGKESGEIEYSADSVLFLAREPWENDQPPPLGTVFHLAVAKNRRGTTGWHRLLENWGRFTEDEVE
jgi:replicative DNA helicase